MQKRINKIFAMLLAVLLAITCLPQLPVKAAEPDFSGYTSWEDPTKLPATEGRYILKCDVTVSDTYIVPSELYIALNGYNINVANGQQLEDTTNTLNIVIQSELDMNNALKIPTKRFKQNWEIVSDFQINEFVKLTNHYLNIYGGGHTITGAPGTHENPNMTQQMFAIDSVNTDSRNNITINNLNLVCSERFKNVIAAQNKDDNNYGIKLKLNNVSINHTNSSSEDMGAAILNLGSQIKVSDNFKITTGANSCYAIGIDLAKSNASLEFNDATVSFTDGRTSAQKADRALVFISGRDSGNTATVPDYFGTNEMVKVLDDQQRVKGYNVKHAWTYSASKNTLTASCNKNHDANCTEAISLTLSASDVCFSDSPITPVIVFGTSDQQAAWTNAGLTVPEATLDYYATDAGGNKTGNKLAEIKEIGNYIVEAKIAAGALSTGSSAVTVPVSFAITKAHEHNDVTFLPWDKDNELPQEGNYYLTKDVTLNNTAYLKGNLCLNGYVIKMDSYNSSLRINPDTELSLYDCESRTLEERTHIGYMGTDNIWHLGSKQPLDQGETAKNIVGGCITGVDTLGNTLDVYGCLNMYGGTIAGNINSFGSVLYMYNTGKFNMYGGSIFGNIGEGVRTSGEFRMQGGTVSGNTATDNGGGVNVRANGKFIMTGGEITNNTATNGAGVYLDGENEQGEKGSATLLGGTISNNIATVNGGGVFLGEKEDGGCIAEGTMITMADGSRTAVENLKVGDSLRVFDHESGNIKSSVLAIDYIHKKPLYGAFTLHFSGDVNVKVVDEHAFFEKQANNYVILDKSNVKDFIGHSFYDLDNDCWRTLDSVTKHNESVMSYALYTANYLNHVTEGMLSCEGLSAAALCNPFALDKNMKIIPKEKEKDIAKWGLFTYEKQNILIREAFDMFPVENLNVAIGKGYITMKEFEWMMDTFGTEVGITKPKSNKDISESYTTLLSSPPSFDDCNGLTLGGSIKIVDNKKSDSTANDFYLDNNKCKISTTHAPETTMSVGLANNADTQITDEANLSDDVIVERFFVNSAKNPAEKVARYEGDIWVVEKHSITNNAKEADKETNNGYVTVSESEYSFDAVTVDITPNEGYHLKELKYPNGLSYTTITKDNGVYSFVMPARDIVVEAEFEQHGAWAYEAEDNKLTAKCGSSNCDFDLTLTLSANDTNYSDELSPSNKIITVGTDDERNAWKAALGDEFIPVVHYVGKAGSSTTLPDTTTEPTTRGHYTAKISAGTPEATATIDFDIIDKHSHSFTYSANGDTLTATCNPVELVEPCGLDPTYISLTLIAGRENYTGNAIKATIAEAEKTAWKDAGLTVPDIKYYGREGTASPANNAAPIAVGKYTAKITAGDKTASKNFEIVRKSDNDKYPDNVEGVAPTTSKEPGTITNLEDGMEIGCYDEDSREIVWTPVTSETMTVPVGTYYVRFVETEDTASGKTKEIVVPRYEPNKGEAPDAFIYEKRNEDNNYSSAGLENTEREIFDISLTEKDQDRVLTGDDGRVWLEVNEYEPTDNEIEKFDSVKSEDYETAFYFEANLWKQIGNDKAVKVRVLPNGKLKVSIFIPKELRKDGRTYDLIRLYNNTAEVLRTSYNKSAYTLEFETNRFSAVYDLMYMDKAEPIKPDPEEPGDTGISLYRFYDPVSGDHVFLSSKEEGLKAKYLDDKVTIKTVSKDEGVPVYSLYSAKLQDHIYTTDKAYGEFVVNKLGLGYDFDYNGAPAFYSGGKTAVYSFCVEGSPHHLYSASETEANRAGYKIEMNGGKDKAIPAFYFK